MKLPKYDTIYRRLFAKIFDYILIGALIMLIKLFLPETTYNFDFDNPDFDNPLVQNSNSILDFWTQYSDLIVSFLLITYFVLFHFFTGQTIGKMITNVKVWDLEETNKISFAQAILRNLPDIVFSITTFIFNFEYLPLILICIWNIANLIQVFSNKKFRTFNDLIARTVVIRNFSNESNV